MSCPWSRGHLRHPEESAFYAVCRVVRVLEARLVGHIDHIKITMPWEIAMTLSAVGGRLNQDGGSLSGNKETQPRKCSILVPSGAVTVVPVDE